MRRRLRCRADDLADAAERPVDLAPGLPDTVDSLLRQHRRRPTSPTLAGRRCRRVFVIIIAWASLRRPLACLAGLGGVCGPPTGGVAAGGAPRRAGASAPATT